MDEQFVSSKVDKFGVFFETRSFKIQRKVYRIDLNQLAFQASTPCVLLPSMTYSLLKPILWKESNIHNLDEIEMKVQYDSYRSFDGVEVPMTIIQKKCNDDPEKPCLIYAYGGYGDSILPRFDLYFLLFIEFFNGIVGRCINVYK